MGWGVLIMVMGDDEDGLSMFLGFGFRPFVLAFFMGNVRICTMRGWMDGCRPQSYATFHSSIVSLSLSDLFKNIPKLHSDVVLHQVTGKGRAT